MKKAFTNITNFYYESFRKAFNNKCNNWKFSSKWENFKTFSLNLRTGIFTIQISHRLQYIHIYESFEKKKTVLVNNETATCLFYEMYKKE